MKYVCDAPGGKTWFRIETEAEAAVESEDMRHAVEKFFRKEHEKAVQSFQPPSKVYFEQEIGLKAHMQTPSVRWASFTVSRSREAAATPTAATEPRRGALQARGLSWMRRGPSPAPRERVSSGARRVRVRGATHCHSRIITPAEP